MVTKFFFRDEAWEAGVKGQVRRRRASGTSQDTREIIRFPDPVCRELLAYAKRMGIGSGPIFLTRSGKPMDRTYAAQCIRRLCPTAQVPEEKGSPRCLRKMYRATRSDMEHSIALLVEQAQDRLLEEEQLTVGWDR